MSFSFVDDDDNAQSLYSFVDEEPISPTIDQPNTFNLSEKKTISQPYNPIPKDSQRQTTNALKLAGLDLTTIAAIPGSILQKGFKEAVEYIRPDLKGKLPDTYFTTIQNKASEIPIESSSQETLRRALRSTPALFGGPAAYALMAGSDIAGQKAAEAVEEAGGGEFAQAGADIGVSLLTGLGIPKLFQAGKTLSSASKLPAITEEVGTAFTKAEMAGNQRKLQSKIATLGDNLISDFNKNIEAIDAKPLSKTQGFSALEIEQDIAKQNKNLVLDSIAPEQKAQDVWSNIQNHVNEKYKAESDVYRKLYTDARSGAKSIKYSPRASIEELQNLDAVINNIETMGSDYSAVNAKLKSALKDSGYIVETKEVPQILDPFGSPIGPKTRTTVSFENVTVDKLMDLAVRLSDVINYETLTPNIKKLLKPIVSSIKNDIRTALGNSPAGSAYNLAEEMYANTANRFNKKSIMNLRSTEQPEKLTSLFNSPSNYQNLSNVVDSNLLRPVQRAIIQDASLLNPKKASSIIDQLPLNSKTKQTANEFFNLGDKLSSQGQYALTQNNVLSDVQKAVTSGSRPSYTLNTMQSETGYNLVKNTLSKSPKGKEIFKSLQKQLLSDVAESITDKSGKVDWNKAKDILADKELLNIMKDIGGNDLVNFLRSIENYSNNITSNLNRYGGFKTTSLLEKAKQPVKDIIYSIGLGSFLSPIVGVTYFTSKVVNKALTSLLSNPTARNIIRSLANTSLTQTETARLIQQLNKAIPSTEQSE
jgi:hypothetical protein